MSPDCVKYGIGTVCQSMQNDIKAVQSKLATVARDTRVRIEPLPLIPPTDILPYKGLPNIVQLPVGSVHTVIGIGKCAHYGQAKLVIKLNNQQVYQAGDYLEEYGQHLHKDCAIVLDKVMTNRGSNRRKFMQCKIVKKGNWAGLVDYAKAPLLPPEKSRMTEIVLDVKIIRNKGQKRKLILVEDGTIYKIKKSKLEQTVKPGCTV
jgi:hypothetical protein